MVEIIFNILDVRGKVFIEQLLSLLVFWRHINVVCSTLNINWRSRKVAEWVDKIL
jgi:hypothetical protein